MKKINFIQIIISSVALLLLITVLHNKYFTNTHTVTTASLASLHLPEKDIPLEPNARVSDEAPLLQVVPPQEFPTYEDTIIELQGSIQSGDSLDSSLRRLDLSANARQHIINSFSSHIDFRRLDTKDYYTVRLSKDGELLSCLYEAGPLEIYLLEVKDGKTTVAKNEVNLVNKTVKISGTIDSSLFLAFAQMQEQPSLVYAFAEIFSSKLDFNSEPQKGDTFSLVVDKYYKDDTFIGYGKIQVAQYVMTNGKRLDGYYFVTKNGTGAYFDNEGKEVGTSFLRSPVPMGRVTSGFTYRRKHPITGKIQPHLGVDLAAPVGTPILAASDGKVISIGTKGPNGRQIVLSHNGGVKTYYGHLSRYKKGLRKGDFVNKKEVIGYVGSSGRSTGPHLDYRIKKAGVFKNPFSLEFTPRSELLGEELAQFQADALSLEQVLTAAPKMPENIVQVNTIILTPDQKLVLL